MLCVTSDVILRTWYDVAARNFSRSNPFRPRPTANLVPGVTSPVGDLHAESHSFAFTSCLMTI